MAPESKNQALVEGAFFAALTAVIALMGLFFPPLFVVTSLLMPLPLAVLVRRRDLKMGMMALLVAGVLIFMLSGRPLAVLILMIQLGPLGLLLGLLFKNHVRAGLSVVLAGIFSTLLLIITLGLSFWLTGVNPVEIGSEMARAMEQVIDTYKGAGMLDPEGEEEARALMQSVIDTTKLMLPAILVLSSVMSAFITYLIGRMVLIRLGYGVTDLPPFSRWRLPWYLIWGLIVGLSLILSGDHYNNKMIGDAGQNIMLVSSFIYILFGLSVALFFVKNWKISRVFKIMLAVMGILYLPFAATVLLSVGIMDSVVNVRRLPDDGDKNAHSGEENK